MSQKINIKEERHQLMNELFGLYDSDNYGYISNKEALRIVASMKWQLGPDKVNDFLVIVDPRNEGRVIKKKIY